jgi:hypothetical protein
VGVIPQEQGSEGFIEALELFVHRDTRYRIEPSTSRTSAGVAR